MGLVISLFSKPAAVSHPVETYFNTLGRYQYFVFAILFSAKFPLFYHLLNHMIISPKIDFYCGGTKTVTNKKIEFSGEKNKCPCKDKVHWDTTMFSKTTNTKFNLHCETEWIITFSKSIVFVGLLFGGLFFGFLADKFGRVKVLSASFLLTGVAGFLVTVMPNAYLFCVMRFIEGVGAGGAVVVSYVLMIEYCGPRNREATSALFHLPLNFSHLSMGLLSFLIRDCDIAMYFMSIPLFPCAALTLLILESPKWLVDTGRIDRAAENMKKICKFNKRPCENVKESINAYLVRRPQGQKKVSVLRCLRYRQILFNFLAMTVLYFTCGLSYYGVSQYISEMGGSLHFNIIISGSILIPGTIVSCLFLKFLNRKPFIFICLIGAGVAFLIVIILPKSLLLIKVLCACLSNCFFFMLFIVVFLYGCELFPTCVRNSMLALLSLTSRVGTIIAPYIIDLKIPYLEFIFCFLSLLSAAFMIFLPETKNKLLPATIEDALAMTKKKKVKTTQT